MTSSDVDLATLLATDAGRSLIALRHGRDWPDTGQLKDAGDATSQQLIADALAQHRPDDRVLSEEAADDPRRLDADRVWIIDPLDGTREYSEGRDDWAIHVALWERGELGASAVSLPGLGLTLATDPAPVAPDREPGPWRIAVSRSRPSTLVTRVAAALDAELVPMGSAGYKTCAVIRGEVDAYLHSGGQYEWDSAAPVAVAQAAGLHASRVDGSPLRYNRPDPYLPDLVVCRPEFAADLMTVIARVLSEDSEPLKAHP